MVPRLSVSSARFAWLKASALLLASVIAVAGLTLKVDSGTEIVAVAFPPWWSTEEAMQAAASADAAIVRTTALPTLLVVRPGIIEGWAKLRTAGAWFAIDPQAVAACVTSTSNTSRDSK